MLDAIPYILLAALAFYVFLKLNDRFWRRVGKSEERPGSLPPETFRGFKGER